MLSCSSPFFVHIYTHSSCYYYHHQCCHFLVLSLRVCRSLSFHSFIRFVLSFIVFCRVFRLPHFQNTFIKFTRYTYAQIQRKRILNTSPYTVSIFGTYTQTPYRNFYVELFQNLYQMNFMLCRLLCSFSSQFVYFFFCLLHFPSIRWNMEYNVHENEHYIHLFYRDGFGALASLYHNHCCCCLCDACSYK